MYFKKIEMHGFKSFAEPVSIEFDKGITCIVGPNGSGKSNISDAIRWVLGEQSPKTLRGGKMEDIIFAGTESRKSRGMAEVTLTIDNTKGILPIDYNEVAITRKVFRSGDSEYYINNNQCRLKDIRELIMDTGIGVDGYSLIGQGKISDMVSNKTESRREIFEEAAGIVKYRNKKHETEIKLKSTEDNLNRVNDIISEIEDRIKVLKKDSEKAKKYIILRDKYNEIEISVTLRNIDDIDLKLQYIIDDISELSFQIDICREKNASSEHNIEINQSKIKEFEDKIYKLSQELLEVSEYINKLENIGEKKQNKILSLKNEFKKNDLEISELSEKNDKDYSDYKILNEKINSIQCKKNEKENLVKLKEEDYNNDLKEYKKLEELINNMRNEISTKENHAVVKKSEMNTLKSLLENLDKRENLILVDDSESICKLEVEKKISEHQTIVDSLIEEIRKLKTSNNDLNLTYAKLKENEKKYRENAEKIRINIGQAKYKKKMLEDMENRYEGYSSAVKHIMDINFSGVEGVIADLIKVPQGFETAIETCLGGAMQNIVCKRDNDAQAIIKSLKENKAGRITLLPMQSIKSSKENLEFNMKNGEGFRGLAVDCIEFDKKYENVMNYLLGRVIVVDSLRNAINLSKMTMKSYRFVTLDGELVNPKGAITGGAYRKNNTNLLERKNEINKLEKYIEKYQKIEEEEKKANISNESNIIEVEKNIESNIINQNYSEKELIKNENILNNYDESLKRMEELRTKNTNQIKYIREEKDSALKMIEEINQEINDNEKYLENLKNDFQEINKNYYEKKIQIEEENIKLTEIKILINSFENEINAENQIVKRILNEIESLKFQIEKKTEENIKISNELIFLEKEENAKNEKEKKLDEKNRLEKYIAELRIEKDNLSNLFNENLKEKQVNTRKLESYINQKHEIEIKKNKFETQIESMKNKLWEEFEIPYIKVKNKVENNLNIVESQKEAKNLKIEMKKLGEINIHSIKEYQEVKERYDFLNEQRYDILSGMESLNQIIENIDKTIKDKFRESFNIIMGNFEIIFKDLFGGGKAILMLENEKEPLESGIEIIAQPPGKKLQNINLMSGGEKTMTAIALMFAVLKSKPTPFCILDEIEAALDDNNIERFAKYLKNFNNIQFALVTHQRVTMEHGDVLYGVTMPERGISKILSLKMEDSISLN